MQAGLSALRVVDLSTGIPGGYCSRLLADAGADVVKVEPPGGDPWRAWSAGGATVEVEVGGALFQFLHHGMRSVVGRPGDGEVEALVAGADVVVESFLPSEFDSQRWLDDHPGLIVCSITPYGRTGPFTERPTTEFIVQAESGGLVGRGSVRRVPFQAGGRTSEWLAGTFSAMAVAAASRRAARLGARRARRLLGRRGHDHRGQQLRRVHAPRWLGSPPIVGATRTIETPSVEPTLDGYVGVCTNSREQFDGFLLLIDRPDLIGDDEFGNHVQRQTSWDEWNEHRARVDARSTPPRRSCGWPASCGSPSRRCTRPPNILDCDHFVARGIFVDDAVEFVQDAATTMAHERRRPAAAPTRTPPGRAHGHHRGAHAGAPRHHRPTIPICHWRECACST